MRTRWRRRGWHRLRHRGMRRRTRRWRRWRGAASVRMQGAWAVSGAGRLPAAGTRAAPFVWHSRIALLRRLPSPAASRAVRRGRWLSRSCNGSPLSSRERPTCCASYGADMAVTSARTRRRRTWPSSAATLRTSRRWKSRAARSSTKRISRAPQPSNGTVTVGASMFTWWDEIPSRLAPHLAGYCSGGSTLG